MRKNSFAILVSIAIIIAVFPASVFGLSEFTDMPNNWSTAALKNAVSNGLLKGSNGKIMPNENLTRAQMAAVVNRAFGTIEKVDISKFTDVSPSAWYYDDMAKAVQMQTFKGDGSKLSPESNITREEAFVVLSRAFKLSGANLGVLDRFTDSALVSTWAKDGVASLVAAGYVNGSNGILNPKQNITRAEFAKIMDNLVKVYIKEAGTYTSLSKGNVMINVPNVTLKDVTVEGDLIIGDGVGDGDVVLDNVNVTGRTIIRGGGENSIRITGNSNIKNIVIARVDGKIRVLAEDGTEVGEVVVDGNDDVIIEGTIGTLTVAATDIQITANNATIENVNISASNSQFVVSSNSTINKVTINAEEAKVEISGEVKNIETTKQAEKSVINVADGGKVEKVEVNSEGTKIEGKGSVKSVEAKADNVEVNTKDTEVTVEKGVSGVKVDGKEVVSDEKKDDKKDKDDDRGGSSGGGGTTPTPKPSINVSVLNQTILIGLEEQYDLLGNLNISPSDATAEFTIIDGNQYAELLGDAITGKSQGRVSLKAVISKEGYISKTVTFDVLVAPVLLEWNKDTFDNKAIGQEEDITVKVSLIEGCDPIENVDIILILEKKVNSEWGKIEDGDILLKDATHSTINGENGFYRLVEDQTISGDLNINANIIFNTAGEYKLTVYAIKK